MEKKNKAKNRSLRSKMLALMMFCWLLPVLIVIGSMGFYVYYEYNNRINSEISSGLETGLGISADRLDSAVNALRRTAYDGSVLSAWQSFQRGDSGWVTLHSSTSSYLMNQFRGDSRFPVVGFWFIEDPAAMRVGGYIEDAGGSLRVLNELWDEDFEGLFELAKTIDTYSGIYENEGRVYLVRNLTSRFEVIGTQVMRLNIDEFVSGIEQLAMGQSVSIWLNDRLVASSGDEIDIESVGIVPGSEVTEQGNLRGGRYTYSYKEGDGYILSAFVRIDSSLLFSELRGYITILIVMLLMVGPLLFIYHRFYDRNVTKPVRELISGAKKISGGEFGYQIEGEAGSEELQYITDSFNDMSGTLNAQFEHIYREEISLRDAKIKALQSQINPHFLNNTLEIINWEVRLGENAKVTQMVEALSTLLDALVDRDSKPEIKLYEELRYINAYLLIIDQRFGKRLSVVQKIGPETLNCMVPKLILQPLVENAVEHGINPGGYGRVSLKTFLNEEGNLIIEVENDGKLSESNKKRIDKLLSPDYDTTKETSYNLGIANVNSRLKIIYGPSSGLTIASEEGRGTVARITIVRESEPQEEQ